MAVEGIRNVVETAIARASKATGVDFGFLMKTAGRESGMNPGAKAGSSSAAGLFQFVEQTWLSTLKQHGAKHGYGAFADAISKGADGRYRVSGDARRAVMDLRFDPHAASMMAGELASDHAAYLKGRTGREPTAGELYAAHFLGPQGSARLIQAVQSQPGATAANLFPDAARANKAIFYRDGRPASVGELYANLTRTGGDGPGAVGPAEPAEPNGFIQYARAGHADTQAALIAFLLRGREGGGGEGLDTDGLSAGRRAAGSMFTSEMLKLLSESRET